VARIHALLMVSNEPLSTDEIMETLSISRGGAHGALRQLTAMGIAQSVIRKGERKERFTGEKDPWKVFVSIMRERKRREVEPVLSMLNRCLARCEELDGPEAREFESQLVRLQDFVRTGDRVMETLGRSEQRSILGWMMGLVEEKVSLRKR
ncbi:MAG: transcriptional regulator, partial [Candidatus Sulfomarinibacteraceae bacterium]